MKFHSLLPAAALILLGVSCTGVSSEKEKAPIDYVNTLIGTRSNPAFSHGNTYPAVTRPWGMTAWTPQTGLMNDNWLYTYQSDTLRGFRHTHLPSPWIGDYAAFTLMPVAKELKVLDSERGSRFFHEREKASPHYYSVNLHDYDIDVEMTATERCGMMRFTYNRDEDKYLVLDAFRDGAGIRIHLEERKITGYCKNSSGGTPENFVNHFVLYFDTDFEEYGVWNRTDIRPAEKQIDEDYAGAYLKFPETAKTVTVKIASSYISPQQAEITLKREIGENGFDRMVDLSRRDWSSHLEKITVEGGSPEQMRTFYSNLYRVLIYPRQMFEYDENNDPVYFSVYDGKIHSGYMFTDNGFWDTFRSAHPFYSLMFPQMSERLMQALIDIYEQGGWLPNWTSPGYRNSMIGSHAISLLADAYSKGITSFDAEKALQAVKKECSEPAPYPFMGRYGFKEYMTLGYLPYPEYREAVSSTLEYAYDDYCAMRLAGMIGKKEDEASFKESALKYKNVFNPQNGFMCPKKADGKWYEDFDPYRWGGPFTEGNAIQYSWSVLHDVNGLANLLGGKEAFISKLDSVFTRPTNRFSLYNRWYNEVAETHYIGLGQYSHGNQPAQHITYLYPFVGQPWKTQMWTRRIMDKLYDSTQNGYIGDEDNGQTSSWYVFSALGMYPLCPGSEQYILGSPLFKKATLKLDNGKTFVISAPENSPAHPYIGKMTLNGKPYTATYLHHRDIVGGGVFELSMQGKPDDGRKFSPKDLPYSLSELQ